MPQYSAHNIFYAYDKHGEKNIIVERKQRISKGCVSSWISTLDSLQQTLSHELPECTIMGKQAPFVFHWISIGGMFVLIPQNIPRAAGLS
ncbi:hypothetical protein GWI33_007458 [Rhynchophorus ferrugineus]|uniref:Uncharacterized protein n=1 Tax=Rhynchophorus ferrugineus TaxID=354439 RepID=A0A834IHK6_RHYFE|nr:hypothetical protein GWI33_007458 [Rhynchophorus ferrugineus]